MNKCPQTGKERHPSKGKADAHCRHLKTLREEDSVSYYCPYCGGWHVGRKKSRGHESKY